MGDQRRVHGIFLFYSFFVSKRVVLWHQEVASFPFSFLMNSSWLLVFLFHMFYILFLGLLLKCWKGIYFSHYFYLLFNFLFFGIVILFHFWFRDLLRESYKKVEVLCVVLFLVFLIFVFSEAVLFVSFFWSSFHSSFSPTLGIWPVEGLYLPDPLELAFANTLLLSNAAVSLGGAFVSREICCSSNIFSLLSFIQAWTFISLQLKEFLILGLSINDSVYGSLFFFLTGLHFFHVVVGLILISLVLWSSCFSYKASNLIRVSERYLFYSLQLIYWHFVEVLWLFIFAVLYFY